MKTSAKTLLFWLVGTIAIAAAGAYIPTQAKHDPSEKQEKKNDGDVTIPPDYNRHECTGPTCVFIASWVDKPGGFEIIEAVLTMNTFALEFGIENAAGQVTTFLGPGESFTIPIDGTGEIIGHAGSFSDTPPITFQAGGTVRAETQGLTPCGFDPGSITEGAKQSCELLSITESEDIFGTWSDTWAASSPAVECATQANGTVANCTSTDTVSGTVTLTLTRTVDDMVWHNTDKGKLRLTPVIAYYKDLHLLTTNPDDVQKPFPGSMSSSVQVHFGGTGQPECSDTIDNDGDGDTDCEDFGCWVDPQDPATCDPNDTSEEGSPEFDPGGFRETE